MGQTGRRSIATHILAVKIGLAEAHLHSFGVARQGPWITWVNRGKRARTRAGICSEGSPYHLHQSRYTHVRQQRARPEEHYACHPQHQQYNLHWQLQKPLEGKPYPRRHRDSGPRLRLRRYPRLRTRLRGGLLGRHAPYLFPRELLLRGVRASRQVVSWVAGPSLGGGQVAVSPSYASFTLHVTTTSYYGTKGMYVRYGTNLADELPRIPLLGTGDASMFVKVFRNRGTS